jgi:hypothetical protein
VIVSDEKKKKSADDIIDEKAVEMGVDKKRVPASDESAENVMAGLGGVFDVPASKKKKKKAEPVVEAEADEDEESDVEEAAPAKAKKADKAEKPEKKTDKPKKKNAGVDLFMADDSSSKSSKKASYLDADDLGDLDMPQKSNTSLYIGVAVVALVIGLGSIAAFGSFEDVGALLSGDLRERRLAEKEQIEAAFKQQQLDAMDKFGNLIIAGNPQYAMVKVNGQLQYGQTSSEEWRELQLGPSTAFQNLNIRTAYNVEITAPGYQPLTLEITEGKWQEQTSGDFSFVASANLTPLGMEAKQEADARLSADVETEYFGAVSLSSTPPGALVIFNNYPLVNAKGEDLRTPVTFDKYYVKDEKTGKLEERPINVDSILDQGHKIQLQMPAESGEYPKYVTSLQRQNWTCDWKTESELNSDKFNADKDSVQKKCKYNWNFNLDFNNLKKFIADRAAEKKRIEDKNRAIQEEAAAAAAKKDE